MIIGIDPGANTGKATFIDGKLTGLETIKPYQLAAHLRDAKRVIFEDSRLISHLFTTDKSRPVALNMARKVGQVDAYCNLIVDICEHYGIPAHGISPKAKGAKLNAKEFESATGWNFRCNEHERDAAMVAWRYRGAK